MNADVSSVDREIKIATADKSKPLAARANRGGGTCALCGCELREDEWVVTLPDRLGKAQPGCAADRGWTIR